MRCTVRLSATLRALLGSAFCVLTSLTLAQQRPMEVERLGVSETLLGILSYARWPNESMPLRLCVVGRGIHTEHLLKNGLAALAHRPIVIHALALDNDTPIATQCDALYIGTLDESTSRRIFSNVVGSPVLTVSERIPPCAAGAMVCLDPNDPNRVHFEVNLDAVARSGVRVNPQVLRLGRRAAKALP